MGQRGGIGFDLLDRVEIFLLEHLLFFCLQDSELCSSYSRPACAEQQAEPRALQQRPLERYAVQLQLACPLVCFSFRKNTCREKRRESGPSN